MASTLPSVSDCCSLCEGLSVTLDTSGVSYREVYYGSGDPNGVVTPDNTQVANLYYNTAVPGEMWWWNVAGQNWSKADIRDVAAYLNWRFYHLPCHEKGCAGHEA